MSETIPTVGGLPVVGSALEVGSDPFDFLEGAAAEYGPVFRVSIPGLSFVCYADAKLVERALVTECDRYRKDDRERDLLGEFLGEGALTARGERWERGRRQVQPAFTPGRIAAYAEEMVGQTERVVGEWADCEVIDVHEEATRLTLSIVASTMFGLDSLEEAGTIAERVDAITDRFAPSRLPVEIPLWAPTPANRRYRRAAGDLEGIVDRLIARREPGDEDLCATLLSAMGAGEITESEVRDQLLTVLLAGHETTAVALTYTLASLATHPAEYDRIAREVRSAGELSARTDLPRTDAAVREALRLYPPSYLLFRQTERSDTVAGYRIPADTRVVCPQWAIHRDPRYYDAPTAFRPGRWSKDRERPDFAYFPFGGGKRACIGRRFALLELRLAVASILRSVDLEATSDTEPSPTPALTCRPDGPVPLRVRR
ncbi:cytochrome P450 [Saliphagus sp. LR7]|uniref:cytochrome P450 n=1 Tax=Saliphagus sp. LR7 TaxID=2282654 RepID=UPI000DF78167|nr:cytochrome P450 [Saliphagus sp. LR7]